MFVGGDGSSYLWLYRFSFCSTTKRFLRPHNLGDDWRHALVYEGLQNASPGVAYPRCIGGANARPPEDVGGVCGFEEFKRAVSDADHPEHDDYLRWVGGAYDPRAFDPGAVVCDDPRERWDRAFKD